MIDGFLIAKLISLWLFGFSTMLSIINPFGIAVVFHDMTRWLTQRERARLARQRNGDNLVNDLDQVNNRAGGVEARPIVIIRHHAGDFAAQQLRPRDRKPVRSGPGRRQVRPRTAAARAPFAAGLSARRSAARAPCRR